MATVVLVGTLDTKGAENEFVRDRLRAAGVDVLVVDTGVLEPPGFPPDITRQEVAAAAGADFDALVAARDRGAAITAMAEGAEVVIRRLYEEGRLDGALALGGTGGTSIATRAFRPLPLGVPKIVVSTAASGNTADYIRETDLVLMPSVTDIAGLNRISTRILANAAAAVAGMVTARAAARRRSRAADGGGQHVRRHHPVHHPGPRPAGDPRLRGAGVPHDRHRGPHAGVAGGPGTAGRGPLRRCVRVPSGRKRRRL